MKRSIILAKAHERDERMRVLAGEGKTRRQIAEALSMGHGYTCSRMRKLGIDAPRGRPTIALQVPRAEAVILTDLARQLEAVIRAWSSRLRA